MGGSSAFDEQMFGASVRKFPAFWVAWSAYAGRSAQSPRRFRKAPHLSIWSSRDPLVGGMRLRDVAGTDDDRGRARRLEQTGFGGVGDRVRLVLAGEMQRERDGGRVRSRLRTAAPGLRSAMSIAGLGRDAAHLRHALFVGKRANALVDRADVDAGQRAHVEVEPAGHRHDVGRGAAVDARHLQRGVGRIEALVPRGLLEVALRCGQARASSLPAKAMALTPSGAMLECAARPVNLDVPAHGALVRVDHAHRRRLANDHDARP